MKGVRKSQSGNYQADIKISGVGMIRIGTFKTKEEAWDNYKIVANEWYGSENKWPKYASGFSKGHPLYSTWVSMIYRCYNPKAKCYPRYGGRGVTISEEWKKSFKQFCIDMGEKPNKEYSIDRIDNLKGYCKDNCRWATKSEQSRNRRVRSSSKTGFVGVILKTNKLGLRYMVDISVNNKAKRVGTYNTLNDAVKARKDAELKYWGSVYTK